MLVERLQKTKREYRSLKKQDIRDIFLKTNKIKFACFQHDMAYGDFKDLTRRTATDTILRDKAFKFAKNPKYDGYQRGLDSMVYNFFDKRTSGEQSKMKTLLIKN